MNAYEMSDELLRDNTQLTVKAAYMLRQQADRIAELEKECDWAKDQWDKDRICFKARIAELEKELYFKNYYEELPDTPVGIIGKIGDCPIHDLVHRTTPQIKELSDEEIIAIWYEPTFRYDPVAFARAILKKAIDK